jgi:hypothetical protein
MQPTVHQIPSTGRLGVVHPVTVYPDGVTDCTCEDSPYHRRQCKHQRQVLVLWTPASPSGALVESAATS